MHIAPIQPIPATPESSDSRSTRLGLREQARQDALRRVPTAPAPELDSKLIRAALPASAPSPRN
jgi:hypothetical protein